MMPILNYSMSRSSLCSQSTGRYAIKHNRKSKVTHETTCTWFSGPLHRVNLCTWQETMLKVNAGEEHEEDRLCFGNEFALSSVSSGEKVKRSIDTIKFVLSNDYLRSCVEDG